MSATKIPVAIVGASGYTGVELVKMLLSHPRFEIAYVATSEGGVKLTELHPSLLGVIECDVEKADVKAIAASAELVFLALPHKTAMAYVKELMPLGVKVVDLSADYRLKRSTYEENYCEHIDPDHLADAVYGLPELNREQIKSTSLVANPGCYPTVSILSTLPFLPYMQEGSELIIDAKSGVSGAGKKCIDSTHYVTINDNLFAYNPLGHRHGAEIDEKLSIAAGKPVKAHFVPHLLPATRGMMASVYMQLKEPIDPVAVLRDYYKDEPMVRVRTEPVDLKSVAGTHFCDIYAKCSGNLLFISGAIDNLLRGASSMALVNANLMMGLEEKTAVPTIAYVP